MLRRVRIAVQLIVLAAFLYLLLRTIGVGDNRLGHPVRIFLEIDPLIGLTTWLRTGALHGLLWLSLVTLAMSFVLGRFFCGWICPLGTLSQITLRAGRSRKQERSADRSRKQERSADRYRPRQQWKYLILLFVLGGAAAGSLWSGILDPISLLIRGLALGFGPPVESVVRNGAAALAYTPAGSVTEPLYRFVRDTVMASQQPFFRQGMLLASILTAVLLLSWISRRFWCRSICPLGGLVGVAAKAGVLKLRQDDEACTGCAICAFHCQGAADPDLRGGWRPEECFVCGNCTSSCPKGGLSFGFEAPRVVSGMGGLLRRREGKGGSGAVRRDDAGGREAPRRSPHNPGRRAFIAAAGLGLISGPVGQMAPARHRPGPELIRPPGAGSEAEFLDRCIRCGECMKVCPTGGLQPAGFEAGLAGLWTPVLHPRIGYCEYHCTLCGQVCPTGAIARLTDEEKTETVIGLAYFDTGRCLPYAYGTPCIVCEEHCPTSPKAIVLEDAAVLAPDGTTRRVQRPRVDPHACVGCGICEKVCPMEGRSAVRVAAIGRKGEGGPFDLSF